MIYRFGEFELDTDRYELRRCGAAVDVEPKVLDVLLILVGERHRMVTKQELLNRVWPGVIVTESTMTRAISLARCHNPRLRVDCVEDYVEMMNALNLHKPRLMDIAVPANLRLGVPNSVAD